MMRILATSVFICWATYAGAFSQLTTEQSQTLQEGLIVTADEFILPAYDAQADAARELTSALSEYCVGTGSIDAARSGFTATFLAWQRASVIQFGPVAQAEGPMRIQLWPDPKGFANRAVRAAVRQSDPELVAEGGLEGRSIALTGLTALETLLFSDLPPKSYACNLALAVAQFQSKLAEDLVADWTPGSAFRADYDNALDGNTRYPNIEALVREFLAGAVVYVDRLRKFRLLRGLGNAPGEARPERTEAKLSDAGLESIATGFRALADLYSVPFGLFDVAPDIGGSMDYLVIGDVASSIADRLDGEPGSLIEIVSEDGAEAADLRRFADLLLHHESFLKTGFTSPLGLSAGFTAADGD